jgi:hypothetical protein
MKRIILFLAGFAVCLIIIFFFTVLAQKSNDSISSDEPSSNVNNCIDATNRLGDIAEKAGNYDFWANLE